MKNDIYLEAWAYIREECGKIMRWCVMWLSNLEVLPFCVVMKMNLHLWNMSQSIRIKQLTILLY